MDTEQTLQAMDCDMSTSEMLTNVMATVPGCLATGQVDPGMMMGANTIDSHPREVIDSVAALPRELFQGPNITMTEDILQASRGEPPSHCSDRCIVTSDRLVHLVMRARDVPDQVIVFVRRKGASLDKLFEVSRRGVDDIMDELMAPMLA